MRREFFLLLSCLSVLFLISGCTGGGAEKSIEVVIGDDGQFPEFLVGTWRCEEDNLEVIFEPNGIISSALVPTGRTRVSPGKETIIDLGEDYQGYQSIFRPGLWYVYYSPADRELTVELAIEYFHIEMAGTQVIEGKTRDLFTGKVSEDGTVWKADWYSFPEYFVTSGEFEDYEVPMDSNDNYVFPVAFEKIDSP